MAFEFFESWQISGLQPPGLYQNQTLRMGFVNYFIGKNATGKTQLLSQIREQVRNKANATRTTEDLVAKFVPANRTHNIVGQVSMRGDKMEQFETDTPSAESFFQFLNESEFTKSMVQSKLNSFFEKSIQITSQGSNILMEILEKWQVQQELVKQIQKGDLDSEEQTQIDQLPNKYNLSTESDGMKEFLILLTYVYHPRVKYLVIDEPELHLHPHMINFLLDAIEETTLAKDKQFFIVTHSPTAIRLTPSPDWKYFFFLKDKNKIISFDKFAELDYLHLIPHLNPFKREAFYSDLIILVEGEDDYQIFQNIAKRLGYTGTEAGGFTFFPSWGAYELERLYKFFKELEKKVIIIIDGNIDNLIKKSIYTDDFIKNVINDSSITKRLKANDITDYCQKRAELYNQKTKLDWDEKREIIREELKIINSDKFGQDKNKYLKLIEVISDLIGASGKLTIPEELEEMIQRMIGEFRLKFSKKTFRDLIERNELEELKNKIATDSRLSSYWKDVDKDQFSFEYQDNGNWRCVVAFRLGRNLVKAEFSNETDHTNFHPSVQEI